MRRSRVVVTALSFLVIGILFGSSLIVNVGALVPGLATSAPLSAPHGAPAAVPIAAPSVSSGIRAAEFPAQLYPILFACDVVIAIVTILDGPGCGYAETSPGWQAFAGSVASTSAQNVITLLSNSLNQTAAEVANLNATMAELLTYFESRAEQIVPYFLNDTWNQTTYDQIAIDSGLVPTIEGLTLAFASQMYQAWNATMTSWNNIFGSAGSFPPGSYESQLQLNGTGYVPGYSNQGVAKIGGLRLTAPWQVWSGSSQLGVGSTTYFNLAPGGTIVCANMNSTIQPCPSYTVTDLATGGTFVVPYVNKTDWAAQSACPYTTCVPIETTLNHIGEFDLLRIVCSAACNNPTKVVEVLNGYAFKNVSVPPNSATLIFPYGPNGANGSIMPAPNTMTPEIGIMETGNLTAAWVPGLSYTVCADAGNLGSWVGRYSPCPGYHAPLEGNALSLGSGPSAVPATNNSYSNFAITGQHLVNNTLSDAEAYYLALRAITNDTEYPIPADCTIPTPSQAFPSSVNPGDFALTVPEILASYFSYLTSVGRAFNYNATPSGIQFCGSPNLNLGFGWSANWTLRLNITASVYLSSARGPVYPNGTSDPVSTLSNPATWPIKNVGPTLVFPQEYFMSIPVGAVYPLPGNDPASAILVNWTGNSYYGQASNNRSPAWGVPTYLQIAGYGNFVNSNGTTSSHQTGHSNATGDALYVSSCELNGTAINPCNLAVTYFNHFTYGHVSALVGPIRPPNGNSIGAPNTGAGCGFGALNQWYDGWAGYIGATVAGAFGYFGNAASGIPIIGGGLSALLNGLGCLVAWVILIIIFIVLIYVAVWFFSGLIGGLRRSRGSSKGTG